MPHCMKVGFCSNKESIETTSSKLLPGGDGGTGQTKWQSKQTIQQAGLLSSRTYPGRDPLFQNPQQGRSPSRIEHSTSSTSAQQNEEETACRGCRRRPQTLHHFDVYGAVQRVVDLRQRASSALGKLDLASVSAKQVL
jgi:hypothetical protein